MPNDTTTILNTGVGGDVMDESLVTQKTSGTAAKRARVAVGGDDGTLQAFDAGGAASTNDKQVGAWMEKMWLESRRQTRLLREILSQMGNMTLSDEELDDESRG